MARSTAGESVLERVVRILEAFTPEAPALQVSEVARRAALPVATASRLIAELVAQGLLARDADRRVRVGTRLWELGSRASPTLSLRETAMPVMEELQQAVGHHTQLGILDGDEVLFVERLSAERAVINDTRIVMRLPLHASSSGLVLLAYGSPVLQERILATPRHRWTPATVVEPGPLRELFADVRKQGFAFCPRLAVRARRAHRRRVRCGDLGGVRPRRHHPGAGPADRALAAHRGVDTTVHGLGACLYALASNPAQWDRLRARPDLARVAFDEAVRWESPVQTFFRTADVDVSIGGTAVPEGHKILLLLGAANRDPRHWDDPDTFDLARDPSGHVGFGMGLHQCVGQHVARLEAEALLGAVARRVERLELAGDPERHHHNTLRAWGSLPMRWHVTPATT